MSHKYKLTDYVYIEIDANDELPEINGRVYSDRVAVKHNARVMGEACFDHVAKGWFTYFTVPPQSPITHWLKRIRISELVNNVDLDSIELI